MGVEPVITANGGAMQNVDVSKSAALIPPRFGSSTSYVLNSSEYLTPDLVSSQMAGAGATASGAMATVQAPASGGGPWGPRRAFPVYEGRRAGGHRRQSGTA